MVADGVCCVAARPTWGLKGLAQLSYSTQKVEIDQGKLKIARGLSVVVSSWAARLLRRRLVPLASSRLATPRK